MTKKWSSVKSDLVTTKREASKKARRTVIDVDAETGTADDLLPGTADVWDALARRWTKRKTD